MTPLAWLLILTLYAGNGNGQPLSVSTAYVATEAACDSMAETLRDGPYVTAKCFPTGMGRMSRVTEDGR